jgi:hypothetical protein
METEASAKKWQLEVKRVERPLSGTGAFRQVDVDGTLQD